MEWIDAFTYMADLEWINDPEAILNYGSRTYPTNELLASNCVEAAFLASQYPTDSGFPETAAPLLEAFKKDDGSNDAIPLERIFNTIEAAKK
ncbi:MAG: hypothetical protein JWP19_2228 [Rhodoglobus sp.]|nr:hypothetical protein [Rhodoglobus sp.]